MHVWRSARRAVANVPVCGPTTLHYDPDGLCMPQLRKPLSYYLAPTSFCCTARDVESASGRGYHPESEGTAYGLTGMRVTSGSTMVKLAT